MGKGRWLGSPWLPRTPVGGSNPCQPRGLGLTSQTQLRGPSSRTEHSSHALPGHTIWWQEAHLESRLKERVRVHWRWVPPSYTSPQVCWEQRPKLGAPAAYSSAEHLCLRVRTGWGQWDTHQVVTYQAAPPGILLKGLGDRFQPWLPSGWWWSSKKKPEEVATLPGCLPRDPLCSTLLHTVPRQVALPIQGPGHPPAYGTKQHRA